MSDEMWELQIFHRSAVEKGKWQEGPPPDMNIEDACEAIRKLAKAKREAQIRAKGKGRV